MIGALGLTYQYGWKVKLVLSLIDMVFGYTVTFYYHFNKGNNFSNFLIVSLIVLALLKWGLLFKERICSWRSKFFPVRVDPFKKGGKKETGRVASPESVSIHLEMS